ncbi:hypothetical protein KKH42_04125, partial [bacterium]|nr:hypothetical protein [bacterium]
MDKFEKITAVVQGYKGTGDYIDAINSKMNKTAKEKEIPIEKVTYAKAFVNWNNKKYQDALNGWQVYLNYKPNDTEVIFYNKAAKDILASGEELARQKELEERVAKIFKNGEELFSRSQYVSSIREWERVIKIANDEALFTASTWEEKSKINISGALGKLQEVAKKAEAEGKKEVTEKKKIVIDSSGSKEHYVKGLVSYGQGRIAEAVREWEFAVRLDPNNEKANN